MSTLTLRELIDELEKDIEALNGFIELLGDYELKITSNDTEWIKQLEGLMEGIQDYEDSEYESLDNADEIIDDLRYIIYEISDDLPSIFDDLGYEIQEVNHSNDYPTLQKAADFIESHYEDLKSSVIKSADQVFELIANSIK